MEKLIRSRFARLSLATVLLGAGIWAFFPYLAYRVSSSAFVNAELVRVTAPFSGEVARHLPAKGELIDGGSNTKLIEAQRADRRTLVGLQQQYAVTDAQVALAAAQLEEVTSLLWRKLGVSYLINHQQTGRDVPA